MEHSLEAYLERLPTAKLECILQEIRRGFSAEVSKARRIMKMRLALICDDISVFIKNTRCTG